MNLPDAPHVELSPLRLEQLEAFVVREAENRPRPARLASRRTRAVLATAVLAGVVGGWQAVGLLSGAAPAGAAWSAVPRPLAAPDAEELARTCSARLPAGTTPGGTSTPVTPVLAERRGTSSAVLMGGADNAGVCLQGRNFWAAGRTEAPPLKAGQALDVQENGGNVTEGDAARYVYGRAGSAVTAVSVDTSDGRRVTATVKDGFFFAWWPSGADPTTVTAADATGEKVGSVRTPEIRH